MSIFKIIVVFSILLYGEVLAKDVPILKSVNFNDSYLKIVNTGGRTIVGVNAVNSVKANHRISANISVYLPGGTKFKFICVKVRSKDGRYKGLSSYNVLGLKSGIYSLEYVKRSSYSKELKSYKALDLAILAEMKNDCAQESSTNNLLASGWGKIDHIDSFFLLLNTGKYETKAVLSKKGNVKTKISKDCKKIDHPRVSFDRICKVKLKNDLNLNRIIITRKRYPKSLKPIILNIDFPNE